jgi:fructokinase
MRFVHIVSVGEILWDILDGQEFLGGAPLNFSVSAQKLGHTAHLVSAVGEDRLGAIALRQLKKLSLDTRLVQTATAYPTGVAFVRKDADGATSFEISRPAAFDHLPGDAARTALLRTLQPDWIYFGTLAQMDESNEAGLLEILALFPKAKRFYDVNLRNGHWNPALVRRLSSHATALKLNEDEARTLFAEMNTGRDFSLATFCRQWSEETGPGTVCVTRGDQGCALWIDSELQCFEGCRVTVADTVGAGDAFSAALLHGLYMGWPVQQVAAFANALGALVASRKGATPDWELAECEALITGRAR